MFVPTVPSSKTNAGMVLLYLSRRNGPTYPSKGRIQTQNPWIEFDLGIFIANHIIQSLNHMQTHHQPGDHHDNGHHPNLERKNWRLWPSPQIPSTNSISEASSKYRLFWGTGGKRIFFFGHSNSSCVIFGCQISKKRISPKKLSMTSV